MVCFYLTNYEHREGLVHGGGVSVAAIGASEKSLDLIFCRDYVFQIPVYQRPYAWELEQVEALLDDLLDAMGQGDHEPYFLGSIVLIKQDGMPECEVVDGQQRLTTLIMLLCAIRELASGRWSDDLDQRIRQREDVVSKRPQVLGLRLRDMDQEFFHEYVQKKGGIKQLIDQSPSTNTDSQERIAENVKHLYREVKRLGKKKYRKLASFVIERCYLVVVTTNNPSSAHRIFSVMNDRGLDLSPTDILKADITGKIDKRSRSAYAEKWEREENQIGRERFIALFSHIRMIHTKEKPRRNLHDEFQEGVLRNMAGEEFIDKLLVPYALAYEKAVGRNEDQVPREVRPYLKHLSRLDNVDWIPPVMQLFFEPPPKEQDLIECVRGLERLAYGLFILRANVNRRITRYASVTSAIQGLKMKKIRKSLELDEDEKRSIIESLDGPVYTLARVRMPLLLRLDGLLASGEATYERSTVTIEHVLPQKPEENSEWIKWFPDDDERAEWTHRLANLVLLSWRKNMQASNQEFSKKKKQYFQQEGIPTFPLTTDVINERKWTPKVLRARQTRLVDKLASEWRLR